MDIRLNNKSIQIDEFTSVQQLIEKQKISSKGIAVAINNSVVAKSNWKETKLKENDNIIIITATQGG